MADKFLSRDATTGVVQENLPLVTSTGSADGNRVVSTGADGRLDESLLPVGIGADVAIVQAFEGLSAGDFVYIRNDGGVAKAAKASADVGGTGADGFVLETVATGADVSVYFEGQNTSLTGLTIGTRYYLSDTTPGGVTATPVVGAGKSHQYLGRTYASDTLIFEPSDVIRLVS